MVLSLIGADRTPESDLRLPKSQAALSYAERLHEGQRRPLDGAPFISHPIEVGILLDEAGAADDMVAAGVLHDSLRRPTRPRMTSTRSSDAGWATSCAR
jgi:(p)ppGpp synthase/HD superfamily hydrolase